ncbi:hypothetical protein LTR56_016117 [Elasticomyces elasticus]|nr:hypothetical protein LTR56_016117 [Elasticomyces elasticus]KAK3636244.1 hypothetical protein LTR22_018849 [Elasticomyces elasticus]KAK4918328.1 hypothetical protein LTR49_013878 [Elasticomyces elasticus]KAK5762722.1 hypothetical protein LTS12_007111 [Elasticomyces elasticus]
MVLHVIVRGLVPRLRVNLTRVLDNIAHYYINKTLRTYDEPDTWNRLRRARLRSHVITLEASLGHSIVFSTSLHDKHTTSLIIHAANMVHREAATGKPKSRHVHDNGLPNKRLSLREYQARLTNPFRLLDLPPELRAYVYAYMTATDYTRSLARLSFPVLALVSKQIRAEVLPQFFAQDLHEGIFISNYTQIKLIDKERNGLDSLDAATRDEALKYDKERPASYENLNDTSRSKMTLDALRKREQCVPLFRNVQLKVFSGYKRPNDAQHGAECITFVFSVPTGRVLRPKVDLIEPDGGSLFPDEAARTLEKVRGKADEIAKGRERFLGFTFDDLGTSQGVLLLS